MIIIQFSLVSYDIVNSIDLITTLFNLTSKLVICFKLKHRIEIIVDTPLFLTLKV